MTTQRTYSLVGCLVLALFVVLGTGGCGDGTAKKQHALETDNEVPEMVAIEGMTYVEDDTETIYDEPTGEEYEGNMPMGYQEPGYSDTVEMGVVAEDEAEEGMTCYDDRGESTEATEECEMVDEDESTYCDEASMPAVTEEEDISAEDSEEWDEGDATLDETAEDSAVAEEEGASTLTDNTDEGYSGTVVPYIGGEDETMPDPEVDDTMSDSSNDTPVSD